MSEIDSTRQLLLKWLGHPKPVGFTGRLVSRGTDQFLLMEPDDSARRWELRAVPSDFGYPFYLFKLELSDRTYERLYLVAGPDAQTLGYRVRVTEPTIWELWVTAPTSEGVEHFRNYIHDHSSSRWWKPRILSEQPLRDTPVSVAPTLKGTIPVNSTPSLRTRAIQAHAECADPLQRKFASYLEERLQITVAPRDIQIVEVTGVHAYGYLSVDGLHLALFAASLAHVVQPEMQLLRHAGELASVLGAFRNLPELGKLLTRDPLGELD